MKWIKIALIAFTALWFVSLVKVIRFAHSVKSNAGQTTTNAYEDAVTIDVEGSSMRASGIKVRFEWDTNDLPLEPWWSHEGVTNHIVISNVYTLTRTGWVKF